MKLSIITVVFNGAHTIKQTIDSVVSQDYDDIEYIIIDGGSNDGTMDIVNSYSNKIAIVVSEKDKGIYDAMNKGIGMATGDIIGILNADDTYTNPTVISEVITKFKKDNCDALYSDLVYVKVEDPTKIVRYWKSNKFKRSSFLRGWMPPHPTFFAKKDVYEKYGKFNTKLKISADYELMLRLLYKYKIKASYIPKVLVAMKTGGASNNNIKSRMRANFEDRISWKMNDLDPKFYTLLAKPLQKLKQYMVVGNSSLL